jgi:hypothetical protein
MGTTALRGVVFDSSHAAIAGARVTLINPAQGQRRETSTNTSGKFEFLALQPGSYTVSVEKDGFDHLPMRVRHFSAARSLVAPAGHRFHSLSKILILSFRTESAE